MYYMCGSKDDAKLNDSDHIFVIRENSPWSAVKLFMKKG